MSTVTVDGLAVEIKKVADKNVSNINAMAKAVKNLKNAFGGTTWKNASNNIKSISAAVNTLKNISGSSKNISEIASAMKSLRESFGGTSWKSAPENMKNAARGIETLRKAIYSIDISRLRSLASILAGIRDAKIKISDSGTIADLEDRIASLNRQIEFLQGKRSGIPEGTIDSIYPKDYFNDESGLGGKTYFSSFSNIAKENARVAREIEGVTSAFNGSSEGVKEFNEEVSESTRRTNAFNKKLKQEREILDALYSDVKEMKNAYKELRKEERESKKALRDAEKADYMEKTGKSGIIGNLSYAFHAADDYTDKLLDKVVSFNTQFYKSANGVKKEAKGIKDVFDSVGESLGVKDFSKRLSFLAAPQGSSQLTTTVSTIKEYNETSMQLLETIRGFSMFKSIGNAVATSLFGIANGFRTLAKVVIGFPVDMIKSTVTGLKSVGHGVLEGFKEISNIPSNAINSLWKGMQKFAESIPRRALNAFKSLLKKTVSLMKDLAKAAVNAGKKLLSAFSGQFINGLKNAYSTLNKWLHSLGRIAVYRAMRTAIKEVTSALKEGINNMYEWASLNDNVFKSSMDSMATDALYIKNSFASAIAPAINAIVPIVTRIADAFNKVCNAAARFVAIITGQSTYNAAKRVATEYDNGISDAAESAEDLKNTLLGIDELNVLPDASDSSSGSDSGLNYSDMFEETSVGDVPDWLQNIIDAFKSGDWDGAAKTLAQKLNEIIKNWDAKAWAKKLGAKIQKGLHSALTFLREFDFSTVGKKVANILEGLMEEIVPEDIGAMVAQKLKAIVDLFHGFIYSIKAWEQNNAEGLTVGSYLARIVNGWFDEIDWDYTGSTIRTGLEWVINTVFDFFDNLEGSEIVNDLKEFFESLNLSAVWAVFKERLFNTLGVESWSEIGDKINEVITDKIVPWITDEFGDIEFGTVWETLKTMLCNALGVDSFGDLLTKIKETLGPAIKDGISDALDWVNENFSFWEKLSALLFVTGDGKGKIAALIIAAMTGKSSEDDTELENAGSEATSKVMTGAQNKANESDVKLGVSTKETGAEVMSPFMSAAQLACNSSNITLTVDLVANTTSLNNTLRSYNTNSSLYVSGYSSRKTTKLAKGGVVNSATLFGGNTLVGEAGREAVIPLENNLGYLDSLADRLVSAMNNQSQQEVVSVSMDGEVFYQQMVKKNRQNRVRTGVNAFA